VWRYLCNAVPRRIAVGHYFSKHLECCDFKYINVDFIHELCLLCSFHLPCFLSLPTSTNHHTNRSALVPCPIDITPLPCSYSLYPPQLVPHWDRPWRNLPIFKSRFLSLNGHVSVSHRQSFAAEGVAGGRAQRQGPKRRE
jgi:hypothetical protein